MEQVFTDFSVFRNKEYTPLPDSVPWFIISPSLNLMNPHRDLIEIPDDSVLIPETQFMGHKTGGSKGHYLKLFRQAQKMLGKHLTLEEYERDDELPETIWLPTPQDETLWNKARADMIRLANAVKRFKANTGEYPETLEEVRPYFKWSQLPMDPFSASYFEYEVSEDGFNIICLGKDGFENDSNEPPCKDIIIDQDFEG